MSRAERLPSHFSSGSFTFEAGRRSGLTLSRLRAKDLRTPSRGIRVPVGARQSLSSRVLPYLELSPGCVVSDVTAGLLMGAPLPTGMDRVLHLSSPISRTGPRRRNVVGHSRSLEPDEVVEIQGVPVTSPARTWLDLAATLALEDLVVVGDFLVCAYNRGFGRAKQPLISLDALSEYIARKRRVPGLVQARKALPLLRVGVDSPQETKLRLMLQRALHLPVFKVNYPVSLHLDELPRWVDLGCPQFRTCVEYEGAHHLTPAKQIADKARDQHMLDCGWHQVKIYARDLALGPEWVVPQVEAALKRGGWSAPSAHAHR